MGVETAAAVGEWWLGAGAAAAEGAAGAAAATGATAATGASLAGAAGAGLAAGVGSAGGGAATGALGGTSGSLLGQIGTSAATGAASAAASSLLTPRPRTPGATPVTPMPDPKAMEEAQRRKILEQLSMRGRQSTILTSPTGSNTLGG